MAETIRVVLCKDCIHYCTPGCKASFVEVSEYSGYPEYVIHYLFREPTDYCPYGVDKHTGETAKREEGQ